MSLGYTGDIAPQIGLGGNSTGRGRLLGLPVTSMVASSKTITENAPKPIDESHAKRRQFASSGSSQPAIQSRLDAVELALATLSDTVTQLNHEYQQLVSAPSVQHTTDLKDDSTVKRLSDELDVITGAVKDIAFTSTTHASGTLMVDTYAYVNASGDCGTDVTDGCNRRKLQVGQRVRLLYPQVEVTHDHGKCVYMGCVIVDSDTMDIDNLWLCVYEHRSNTRTVADFAV